MTNDTEIITIEKEIVSSLTNEQFETIEFVDIGWTSRVYLINNGELVFKFARNNKVVEEYKNEVLAYKFLEKKSFEVKLPVVKFEDANLRYFGYEGIVGQTLDKYIDDLSEKEKIIIGQRLSGFLKILHESNLENINIFDISHEEKEFFEKFSISEEFLKTSLKPEIFSAIEFFLENKIKNVEYPREWCAGTTAIHLACQQGATKVYMLGFDLSSYDSPLNNIYKGSNNYLPEYAKGFNPVNWNLQLGAVFGEFQDVEFIWVNPVHTILDDVRQKFRNVDFLTYEKLYDSIR